MPLPDLEAALSSFQQVLQAGIIDVQPGALDKTLFVHIDRPTGDEHRLTYVRLQGKEVTAMVQLLPDQPYEGEPCFSVGWAVPKHLRGQGRAAEAFTAAIKELRNGVKRSGMTAFYVEAVIGEDNIASQRTAEKVIAPTPVLRDLDKDAGVPIVQYVRRIDATTEL